MTSDEISAGTPDILGVVLDTRGVNVAVYSANAQAIEFCVFADDGVNELRRIRLPARSGDIFHGHIAGIAEGTRYGLRAHGPYAPDHGHRFNPSKLLLDPYALAIDRVLKLDPSMFGEHDGGMDDTDSASAMARAIVTRPPTPASPGISLTPWSSTVIYELHVRGFTQRHPEIPEAIRGTFTGLAHPAAIAHLTGLGVTAVELMPPAAWIEERHLAERGLDNYWGYNTVGFLVPDPRLAPGGWPEVRACVAALAAAGIETLVDLVFNHTGEGDALGPTLSLRGLDNAAYFRTVPGAPQDYVNDSGCGNTLALDRPAPLRLAMDSLRAWANYGGVHGFRFDLAPVMGRRADGFDPNAPLLQAIEQDPVLSLLKMIAEPWDIGWGGYHLGGFPHRWGEWNDKYRDGIRKFWRGEPGQLGSLATRLAGSSDVFGTGRAPSRSVNFVSAHDGFTLADMVAYDSKRNAANGEDNRDGTNDNFSWNNGVEGPTGDQRIIDAREADQRALLATLLLSRGTPMLSMGSEFSQSQDGNNNAYAQDNEMSWLDWANADAEMLAWTQRLIAIRRDHPSFRHDVFLTGMVQDGGLDPDVAWCRPDGHTLSAGDWNAADGDTLVMLLADPEPVGLIFNRSHHAVDIMLPAPGDDRVWRMIADSARPDAATTDIADGPVSIAPRSVLVLAEAKPETSKPARAVDANMLDRLARAVGVAPEWWETSGTYHNVGDETKRAVLRAMHLPADTTADAQDSLRRYAERHDHRAVPQALVRRVGEAIVLPLSLPAGLSPRSEWLTIALEDGSLQRVRAGAADAVVESYNGADGRTARRWLLDLPVLPMGRHRVWREDAPEESCGITIAPQACYLPPSLSQGHRRFGVSAQLYTIRRDGDQGLGDLTTLRDMGLATRQAGGAVLGLNPMHAMFAADRGRASPYQPSDRRFLDPIYLDLPEADAATAQHLSQLPSVDYRAIWALKSPLLEQCFRDAMAGTPDAAYQGFVARGGAMLHRFAVFEAISEYHLGLSWHDWPQALRHPGTASVASLSRELAGRVEYHQYLQFLCDQQLSRAAVPHDQGGLEIGFIRDLAVGCAPDGAEAWALAEMVGQRVSIGAPPDPFSAEGQVWGLPPPNPHLMGANGYAAFAGLLEANLRHAGGLRIDHALGLARLFWVPDGARGRDGTYVAYPIKDLLGQIALESVRAKALVIGEDLGTVPDGLREMMTENDILSYRVLLLERSGRGFKAQSTYPSRAVACVSTHDLPTFVGWMEGADVTERVDLGQRSPEDAQAEMAERQAENQALVATLGARSGNILADAHAYIAETPADLVYVQADDLTGERQAVNLPGTDQERANWRRRLSVPLEKMFNNPVAVPVLAALKNTRSIK